MPDISTLTPPAGETYDIKDAFARKNLVHYATCETAAGTAAKVVTTENGGFTLQSGAMVRVKFTKEHTYNGTVTLNVDGTGAKDVARVGTTKTTRYFWSAGEVIDFVYDGANYIMARSGVASTTYYGLTKLLTSAINTSTGTALTPASLNSLGQYMLSGVGAYSATATYAIGDRVRYGYYIYECNTAITTAEAWNEAHWTALPSFQEQIDAIPKYDEATTSAAGLMSASDKAKLNYVTVGFATCATDAGQKAKVATLNDDVSGFKLVAGATVYVKFTKTNTYSTTTSNPITLNVGDTGEKQIRGAGTSIPTGTNTTYFGRANYINQYVYDGNYWVFAGSSADNNTDIRPSAYCDTDAATAAKVASCNNYSLLVNSYLHVLITKSNTATSAITLNVNSRGAKPVYINGAASSASNYTLPAGTYIVFYDGTNYYFRTDGKLTASITGDAGMVNGHTVEVNVPSGAKFTDTTYEEATASAPGLMSAGDKAKLNGIASGATANTGTITGVQVNGTNIATSGVANIPAASTSAYGVTKLSTSTSDTSTTTAATPSAVKAAYDLANTKLTSPSGGTAGQVLTKTASGTAWADASGGGTKIVTISLSTSWSGSNPYTQTVTVSGGTANSVVDLRPDSSTIIAMIAAGVKALYVENNKGTFTAYAIGAKPTSALSVQATITEVSS